MATIWVVKIEYEVGSDNGENNYILSAHRFEEKAEAAVEAWRKQHYRGLESCPPIPDEDEDGERPDWCPECHWGASIETVELED